MWRKTPPTCVRPHAQQSIAEPHHGAISAPPSLGRSTAAAADDDDDAAAAAAADSMWDDSMRGIAAQVMTELPF